MPVVNGALGTVLKELERGLEELKIKKRNDYPDYSIIKTG